MSKQWSVPGPLLRASLRACLNFCSKDSTRQNLQQVYFDVRGALPIVVATNGHTIVRVELGIAGAVAPSGFSSGDCKKILKILDAEKSPTDVCIETDGEKIKIGQYSFKVYPERFPPSHDRLFPSLEGNTCAQVNVSPWYLDIATKTCSRWYRDLGLKHEGNNHSIMIKPGAGRLDPITIKASASPEGELTILVMPMRE